MSKNLKMSTEIDCRYFNTLQVLSGEHIMKSSFHTQKILDEIFWYRNIPEVVQAYAAEVVDYSLDPKSTKYKMIFYPFPTLSSMYLKDTPDILIWKKIISTIFKLVDKLASYKGNLSKKDFIFLYLEKTTNRLSEMKGSFWEKLKTVEKIIINEQMYVNYSLMEPLIKKYINTKLYCKNDVTIIHGDLCFSNLLYKETGEIIAVDPRGRWKKQSIYGDIKYDLAKLGHCFFGLYDFIKSEKFFLNELSTNEYELNFCATSRHSYISNLYESELLSRNFNIEDIRLIAGLLFLSMIPLHLDKPVQQKAMYLQGLILLNAVIYG